MRYIISKLKSLLQIIFLSFYAFLKISTVPLSKPEKALIVSVTCKPIYKDTLIYVFYIFR